MVFVTEFDVVAHSKSLTYSVGGSKPPNRLNRSVTIQFEGPNGERAIFTTEATAGAQVSYEDASGAIYVGEDQATSADHMMALFAVSDWSGFKVQVNREPFGSGTRDVISLFKP